MNNYKTKDPRSLMASGIYQYHYCCGNNFAIPVDNWGRLEINIMTFSFVALYLESLSY